MREIKFETESQQVEQLSSKVEWKYGDSLYYPDGKEVIFIGMVGEYPAVKYWCDLSGENFCVETFHTLSATKDTPEQKIKRERYSGMAELVMLLNQNKGLTIEGISEVIYEAGYRKQKETK